MLELLIPMKRKKETKLRIYLLLTLSRWVNGKKTRICNLQYGPRKRGSKDIYYISEANPARGQGTSLSARRISQTEGSTATKIAVSKSEKLNLLYWLFEIDACKIQTVLKVYLTETT